MAASHLLESLLPVRAACYTSSFSRPLTRGSATRGAYPLITSLSLDTPFISHAQSFSVKGICERMTDRAIRGSILRGVPDTGTELAVDVVSGVEAATEDTDPPEDPAPEELSLQEVHRKKAAPVVARGVGIVDILTIFGNLLERPFSSGGTIAAAGYVVIEKVSADVEAMSDDPEVNQQYVFELLRLAKLLSVDMDMVASSRKLETLLERLQQATAHTKQAIQLAQAL